MNFFKKFLYKFSKTFKKTFFLSIWRVGYVNLSIDKVSNSNYKINWFKNSPKYLGYYADAFHLKIKSTDYLIFEDYSFITRNGRISIAEINGRKLINKKIILDNKHLSYPYVFEEKNNIYMICESYKLKKLSLYKINQQKLSLEFVKNIFEDHEAIDPTIIKHNQKYWLFWTKQKNQNSDLYLSFADNLFDDFKYHPQNPIKQSYRSSRPAGTIFEIDGKIFRPSQFCQNFYGEKIVINEILEMNEKNYSEKESYEISSTILQNFRGKKMLGIHNISSFNNKTIVDGYFQIFSPLKMPIAIFRILKKLLLIKKNFDNIQ